MKLKEYLETSGISQGHFAIMTRLGVSTISRAVLGFKIRESSAKRICKASKGKLTMKDFGYI